ncbi:MAG: alanine racemase [Lentisphaeria bacterium]|nr:alanine racemase [Lentisphaeria bacterium]
MADPRVRLDIDLAALGGNVSRIRERVSPCRLIGVVKANAYGTGVGPVAETLKNAGVSCFAVADVNEASEVAPAGLPVLILGALLPGEAEEAVARGFICAVTGYEEARLLSAAAEKLHRPAVCHLKIDTGMGRFGLVAGSALKEIEKILRLPGLQVRGAFSHLASAVSPDDAYTRIQLARFGHLMSELAERKIVFEDVHIAASGGIRYFPETWSPPFTMVRCGLVMYGAESSADAVFPGLAEVLTLKSRLAAVRRLEAGSCIGYGHTYRLNAPALVGTVFGGYADGVPLALTNRGSVIVNGVLCPVVGRVCMDYMMVLLEKVPSARPGDEVILVGSGGGHKITFSDWAAMKGTHVHEILCSIGNRVGRCCS